KKRPAVLATDGTIRTGLYQKECAALGMEAVAPDEETQKLVMSIIYDEIKQGEQGSREKFAQIDRAVRAAGCDSAVLACTELSVFATYHALPSFYLDAMMVLAERSVEICGYPLRTI
ncbi:MAG: aspartate/glutamate racemase family protein, partial [Oscillospiraceae bacterium]|nr:aspartate/glutamate racemase family protein [Oscillospiraceae bacterium]